jgi:hypothetical protein
LPLVESLLNPMRLANGRSQVGAGFSLLKSADLLFEERLQIDLIYLNRIGFFEWIFAN